jgi:hypothetical protein
MDGTLTNASRQPTVHPAAREGKAEGEPGATAVTDVLSHSIWVSEKVSQEYWQYPAEGTSSSSDTGRSVLADAVSLLRFIWMAALQEPSRHYFEVQRTTNRQPPVAYQDALAAVEAGGQRYFGVVPRRERGNTRDHVACRFDRLWVELDEPDKIDRAMLKLDELRLHPAAIVFSGNRSPHCYWGLTTPLAIETVQTLNKRLAQALEGDAKVHDPTRMLRLPGGVHEKSGRQSHLLELSGELFEPARFEALVGQLPTGTDMAVGSTPSARPSPARPRRSVPAPGTAPAATDIKPSPLDPNESELPWRLRDLRKYIALRPDRGWADSSYPSRSEAEYQLVSWLCEKGRSDEQIIARAFDEGWAKASEEAERSPRDPERWIRRTIDRARQDLLERKHLQTFTEGGKPRSVHPNRRITDPELIELLDQVGAAGQTYAEWGREIDSHMSWTTKNEKRKGRRTRERMIANELVHCNSEGRVHNTGVRLIPPRTRTHRKPDCPVVRGWTRPWARWDDGPSAFAAASGCARADGATNDE